MGGAQAFELQHDGTVELLGNKIENFLKIKKKMFTKKKANP